MPPFLVAKKSGVHRLACLSLYHALLTQCSRLRLINLKSPEIRNLIQQNFRKCKTLQSPSQIVNSLKAGYEALDLIHSCTQGNPESIGRLQRIIQQTAELKREIHQRRLVQGARHVPENRDTHASRKRANGRANRRPDARRPHPNRFPVLARPRPHVSGRRRVPIFVDAHGIPFLRIKKPQPPSLSRVILSKQLWRQQRFDRRDRLEDEVYHAQTEDAWDRITGQQDGVTWESPVADSVAWNIKSIDIENEKNFEHARKLWDIVLKERELARQEKEESHKLRKNRRRDKYLTEAGSLTAPSYLAVISSTPTDLSYFKGGSEVPNVRNRNVDATLSAHGPVYRYLTEANSELSQRAKRILAV
ncbi:hypothetical protein FQN55_003368 [Onygenales sp. PD_40]|nr:hypothetical protein FQN55_003368 [Onygenales sp. PD_40]KAK2799644.1 hypothetical protein FQN51_006776 [Onygenales sp. PD_10]